jgi:hypothetical protein
LLAACGGSQNSTSGGASSGPVRAGEDVGLSLDTLKKSADINTQELTLAQSQFGQGGAPQPLVVTKAAARTPVYRFYNGQTGAHFYTINLEERDRVQNTLPVYRYEGEAFFVSPVADAGLSPVYRFYNSQTGVHFYSISADEKAHIEANLPQFRYEGVGYYASKTALTHMVPLYRFYVTTGGFHFYSASESEKDRIRAQLPQYQFENVGYYVFGSGVESFPVGGTLSGLASGQSVVLQINGGNSLTLSADGGFTFTSRVQRDAGYSVTVLSQPAGQTCTVTNGSGTVTAAVSSVSVSCTTASYGVGGTVSGLQAGQSVVLRNNGSGDLALSANGAFTFSAPVVYGGAYGVTIATQPAGQTCTVNNGSGTVMGPVNNVAVSCTVNTYTVGGGVSGLGGGRSVVLTINGAGDLSRTANGAFSFGAPLAHGSSYSVAVKTQPVGQTCSVGNGNGTVSGAVSNITVSCATNSYTVGGTLSGLAAGQSVVLSLNGLSDLTRSTNGAFSFAINVGHGVAYSATVKTQPVGQTCSVVNGSGTVSGPVNNIGVSCTTNTHTVGGSISGLGAGKSVVLQNNAGNNLTRSVNGNFVFSAAVPYGSPYAVSVLTQPLEQTCSVANGLGTVGGTVSNVAVSCADHVTVGGVLSGLVAGNPVVLTLNGGGDLSLSGNGAFTFTGRTPLGATYVVAVKTQPRGQTCTVGNATGTANAAVFNVTVSCANNAPADLLISEVGGCPWQGYSGCWLEVFNPTATTRSLSNYQLRTGDSAATLGTFALPNVSISPGQFRIIASNVTGDVPATVLNPVVMIGNASSSPFWGGWRLSGLVELVAAGSGTTVDAVRFGNATTAPVPVTAAQWVGAPVAAGFTGGVTDQTRSIVRPQATMSSQDTQSALDWVAVEYPTPGGPNDVAPGATDADNDGLPDANEQAGTTYNGLDLYSMGARAGQRDIFVEVDHMNSSKTGVLPNQTSMQMVKNAFALRGFAVHIDVGNRFSAGFDPAQFNLGQGSPVVPYEACLGWAATDCASNTSANYRTVYDWKWQHFDPRRRAVFHYALFGDGASTSSWGRGELFGNDFVVTMSSITSASEWATNQQASTFMHELGHNLGLRHGGDQETNYKPNYLSVMNYLKDGVSPGNSIWPFREWQWAFGSSPGNITCFPGSTHPVCTAEPAPFVIDFSDGSSLPLNEGALYESANVGRGALPGVYADWDENGTLTTTPVARDLNGDGVLGVLTDHNDWAALTLPFVREVSGGLLQKSHRTGVARKAAKVPETGATVPDPLFADRGPTVIVCGDPRGTQILNRLRAKAAAERAPSPRQR